MAYLVRMPQMGMSMDEGTVVEWAVEEGGAIEAGETLVSVESEKSQADVEAREDGVLRRIITEPGDIVGPGDAIGIVGGPDEDISELEAEVEGLEPSEPPEPSGSTEAAEAETGSTADVKATPGARELAAERGVSLAGLDGSGPGGAITERDVRAAAAEADEPAPAATASIGGATTQREYRATPGARKAAEEVGVALAPLEGTGPGGAIIEDDVRAAAEAATEPADAEPAEPAAPERATEPAPAEGPRVSERRPLSGAQATVSRRLGESYRNAVHVTLNRSFDTAAMDEHVDAARTLGMDHGFTDLILKAAADALREHPAFNAHFEDGEHVIYEDVNIGVAVDTDGDLLTPVLRNVDEMGIRELRSARAELTERVQAGEFSMDDLEGGTFTVSNLGMFGVDDFDPIINPPQVAILGVGRRRDDATMTLSLSFDHRVQNGAAAAKFLATIVEHLTDQASLSAYVE